MENASWKTHASRSVWKKRGMSSFSTQFLDKELRAVCAAIPQRPRENQLRVALDFHEQ
jgi:hypothetical protein